MIVVCISMPVTSLDTLLLERVPKKKAGCGSAYMSQVFTLVFYKFSNFPIILHCTRTTIIQDAQHYYSSW